MERSPICPNCLSKHENIHGMLYAVGQTVGTRCDDAWHLGATYNPDRWILSAFDEEFLAENLVSLK
jgi:hypothetical protein